PHHHDRINHVGLLLYGRWPAGCIGPQTARVNIAMPTKQRMVATMNPAAHIEKWNQRLIVLTVVMLISAMLISACGSGGSSQSGQPAAAPGETRAAVPTVPQARFAQPTTMISTNTAITMTSTATATVAAT